MASLSIQVKHQQGPEGGGDEEKTMGTREMGLWSPVGARGKAGEGGGEHTKESKYKVTHGKGKRTFCKVGLGLPYGKGT